MTEKREKIQHWHWVSALLILYDLCASALSYMAALWLRFDCVYSHIPKEYIQTMLRSMPWFLALCLAVFFLLRLYNSIWRFAGFSELLRCVAAITVVNSVYVIGILRFAGNMPASYFIFGTLFQFIALMGVRFSYRVMLLIRSRIPMTDVKRAMLIGAGAAGRMIVEDVSHGDNALKIVCIIDDNRNKIGRNISGIPVVGTREDILLMAKKYHIDQILFAIPKASPQDRRDILNICKETDCELKVLPGIYQMVNGEVTMEHMKDVAIEDLLGRDMIRADMTEIYEFVSGKVIMVTGGGGSIGSELCRQIAAHGPQQLIIFDIYENNAYEIEQELRRKYPFLNLKVLIGSVRDSRRLESVFATYRPEIVYHAAAHKHVPLMETSPCEAVKNNAIGTYKTACAAMKYGTKRFVLISTDKAVNPTNIMGASKRLCEMVIQSMDKINREHREDILPAIFGHASQDPLDLSFHKGGMEKLSTRTEFVAVRFGNVLGSNGSVIPLFKKQIEAGGPVTVTHPDIIRYFMTIPEAVSLVLQAGTYAKGGEIFVLDMGEPVKIDTLARNLIRLSGYTPDVDIRVEYTGLRPGEKLFEEKLMAEEGMRKTANELIHIGNPIPFDEEKFLQDLQDLAEAAFQNDAFIVEKVVNVVSTFHPVGDHRREKATV